MNEEAGICHLIHELQPNVDPAHLAAADPAPLAVADACVADVVERELGLRDERVDTLRQAELGGEEEHLTVSLRISAPEPAGSPASALRDASAPASALRPHSPVNGAALCPKSIRQRKQNEPADDGEARNDTAAASEGLAPSRRARRARPGFGHVVNHFLRDAFESPNVHPVRVGPPEPSME